MKKEKEKNYYLKDSALVSVDDDFFRHQDVANNILHILKHTTPPYNIAVIGKWGLGKSSLINMVAHSIDQEPDNFLRVDINAWKYEKEALAKVFLKQVMQDIEPKKNKKTTHENIVTVIRNVFTKPKTERKPTENTTKMVWSTIKEYSGVLFWWTMITFLAYIVYKCIGYWLVSGFPETCSLGIGQILTGYCRNIGKLIFVPLILTMISQIYSKIRDQEERLNIRIPNTINVEDYEIYLEREIERLKKEKHNDNFRVVIILDDLDRLSVPKMVEALDAIKMFIDYKNCIFVVPFDDSILKKAIQKQRLNDMDGIDIQSELLLDKLFQYKVYLPQLLMHDIKKYAVELCRAQLQDFVEDYMNGNWGLFEDILRRVLIYNEVETPRQVKKIINTFVSNIMIARGRQNSGTAEKDFTDKSDNLYMFAKLSVLQADFNEFYDLLFIETNAMELALEAYQNSMKINELPAALKKYFSFKSTSKEFSRKALPLMNFLTLTARYRVESILPYLYMAMDDISIKTGSKKQQEFRKALLSCNFVEVRQQLQEMPELVRVGICIISDETDMTDIISAFLSMIDSYNCIVDKEELVRALANVCESVNAWMDEADVERINYENLLEIYALCEDDEKREYAKIILRCLSKDSKKNVVEIVQALSVNVAVLTEELKEAFHTFLKRVFANREISIREFIKIKKQSELMYNNEWGNEFYSYLIKTVQEEGDFSADYVSELRSLYKYLLPFSNANTLFEQLKNLYGVTRLADIFLEFLRLDTDKKISMATKSNLIEQQVENEDNKKTEMNPLLLEVAYEVNEEKEDVYCEFFERYYKSKDFSKLLNNYCENNDIELLDAVIEKFIEYVLEEPTSEAEDVFADVIDLFSSKQCEMIKKKIESELGYNSSTNEYPDIKNIIAIYAKNKDRYVLLAPIVHNKISYIAGTSVTEAYVNFIVDITESIIPYFAESEQSKFFDMVCKKIDAGKISDDSICIVCGMGESISEVIYKKLIAKLCTRLSTDTCEAIHELMEAKWDIISKSKDFSNYVDAALLVMQKEDKINRVIERLGHHFNGLSEATFEGCMENIIYSENVNMDKASTIFSKFMDYFAEDNVASVITRLYQKYGRNKRLWMILSKNKKNTLSSIVRNIAENSEQYDFEEVKSILNLLTCFGNDKFNAEISELSEALVDVSEVEDEYIAATDALCEISSEQYRGESKKYVPVLSKLFAKTSSRANRGKIAEKAKEMRIYKNIGVEFDGGLKNEWLNCLGKK